MTIMLSLFCSALFSRNILQASATKRILTSTMTTGNEDITSIHSDHIAEVHTMPIRFLIRPFPSELDEKKVKSLMKTLEDPTEQKNVPPIDVMWIKGRNGGDYYYSFGGCHRYEAHVRLKREMIDVKLVKSTIASLRSYLGASTPDLK